MRASLWVSEFFEWRWAPCVGLTAGSLAFVVLALLVIPTRFDSAEQVANASNPSDTPDETALLERTSAASPRALLGASVPRSFASIGHASEQPGTPPRRERVDASPRAGESAVPLARGFSPVIDRPAPPPDAPLPAAPVAPTPPPVEVAPPPLAAPPPLVAPQAPPPNVVLQQPQQPDADGPRREGTVQ